MNNSPIRELQQAIEIRSDALELLLRNLQGSVPTIYTSLHQAYSIANEVPSAIRKKAVDDIESARQLIRGNQEESVASTLTSLRALLARLRFVNDYIENHFVHSDRPDLSQAILDQLYHELTALGHSYNIVISHGPAKNFEAKYCNLRFDLLGKELFDYQARHDPTKLDTNIDFALIRVPRIEGSLVYWRPILLGHEMAHASYRYGSSQLSQFDLLALLPEFVKGNETYEILFGDGTWYRSLMKIATAWTKELLCDAYSLYRFGPSSIASLAEFLATLGSMHARTDTHPPGDFRVYLMTKWLGEIGDSTIGELVSRWTHDQQDNQVGGDHRKSRDEYRESYEETDNISQEEAGNTRSQHLLLLRFFDAHRNQLFEIIKSSYPDSCYKTNRRIEHIRFVADRLIKGIPGADVLPNGGGRTCMPDIVNAAWIARMRRAKTPVDVLANKAIENDIFLDAWMAGGGELPVLRRLDPGTDDYRETLSEVSMTDRLILADEPKGIIVTPLLQLPAGAGLDLRLSNRFISFRRSGVSSFDPIDETTDPRSIQVYRELSWTEQIVLHPHELMLASTLEYLALPDDVTAHVITRSSYGRLGLLSATAIQVHPRFYGCLTLELVNLSNLPLVLTPGERIVQLVAWTTEPVVTTPDDDEETESKDKYSYPVGPEFSKVRKDRDATVLRRIRKRNREAGQDT